MFNFLPQELVLEVLANLSPGQVLAFALANSTCHRLALPVLLRSVCWTSEAHANQSILLPSCTTSLSLFIPLPSSSSFGWSGTDFSDTDKRTSLRRRSSQFTDSWRTLLSHISDLHLLRQLDIINAPFQVHLLSHIPTQPSLRRVSIRNCELRPVTSSTIALFQESNLEEMTLESTRTLTNTPLQLIPDESFSTYIHPFAILPALGHSLRTLRVSYDAQLTDVLDQLCLPELENLQLLPGVNRSACCDHNKLFPFLERSVSLKTLDTGTLTMSTQLEDIPELKMPSLKNFRGGCTVSRAILTAKSVEDFEVQLSDADGSLDWLTSLKSVHNLTIVSSDWEESLLGSLPPNISSLHVQLTSKLPTEHDLLLLPSILPKDIHKKLNTLHITSYSPLYTHDHLSLPQFKGYLLETDDITQTSQLENVLLDIDSDPSFNTDNILQALSSLPHLKDVRLPFPRNTTWRRYDGQMREWRAN